MILVLAFQTVISFALANFGIYKLDPGQFAASEPLGLFDFFYYSFNALLFNSTPNVTPFKHLAQFAFMAETSCIFFLVVIFISLLFSVRSQRQTEELDQAIRAIENEGRQMEGFIQAEYRFQSIEEAMLELGQLKAGMADFLLKWSENMKAPD